MTDLEMEVMMIKVDAVLETVVEIAMTVYEVKEEIVKRVAEAKYLVEEVVVLDNL